MQWQSSRQAAKTDRPKASDRSGTAPDRPPEKSLLHWKGLRPPVQHTPVDDAFQNTDRQEYNQKHLQYGFNICRKYMERRRKLLNPVPFAVEKIMVHLSFHPFRFHSLTRKVYHILRQKPTQTLLPILKNSFRIRKNTKKGCEFLWNRKRKPFW